MGTVTLKDGSIHKGMIVEATFGIYDGAGFDAKAPGGGSFKLSLGGTDAQETIIPAGEVAHVKVNWVEREATETQAAWDVESIEVTRKDGTQVVGKPSWHLDCSLLEIAGTDTAAPISKRAYPISRTHFNPNDLMVEIQIGEAVTPPPEGGVTPPPEGGVTPPPEGGVTPPPEGGVTPPPEGGVTPPPEGGVTPPTPGEPAMVLVTVKCPHCGQPITVQIDAHTR